MRLDWRIAVGLSVAILVLGCIGLAYLLDPSIFTFSSSQNSGGTLINANAPHQSQSGTYVVHQVTSTATGIYCNCTDSDSQG